jgi:hypothetical protein
MGLRTGPLSLVWLPPEKHRLSHTDLPVIVAPASSSRVTTVASDSGGYPLTVTLPLIIGTPARQVLSLTATVRPASGPSLAPLMVVRQCQLPPGSHRQPSARYRTADSGLLEQAQA